MREIRREPGETRGKLLALLCTADHTTSTLARRLNISSNGVRGQLERLEEEGLVERRVVRRGVGKPAYEYRLSARGSLRLSRAYLPFLSGLLSVISTRLSADEEERMMREVGRTLSERQEKIERDLSEPIDAAARLFEELGGICVIREENDARWLEASCCPLRALLPDHPLVCRGIESMLEEHIGVPVREQCDRRETPTCRMAIGDAPE